MKGLANKKNILIVSLLVIIILCLFLCVLSEKEIALGAVDNGIKYIKLDFVYDIWDYVTCEGNTYKLTSKYRYNFTDFLEIRIYNATGGYIYGYTPSGEDAHGQKYTTLTYANREFEIDLQFTPRFEVVTKTIADDKPYPYTYQHTTKAELDSMYINYENVTSLFTETNKKVVHKEISYDLDSTFGDFYLMYNLTYKMDKGHGMNGYNTKSHTITYRIKPNINAGNNITEKDYKINGEKRNNIYYIKNDSSKSFDVSYSKKCFTFLNGQKKQESYLYGSNFQENKKQSVRAECWNGNVGPTIYIVKDTISPIVRNIDVLNTIFGTNYINQKMNNIIDFSEKPNNQNIQIDFGEQTELESSETAKVIFTPFVVENNSLKLGNEQPAVNYSSGEVLSDNGEYRIIITDYAGNVTEIKFSINKIYFNSNEQQIKKLLNYSQMINGNDVYLVNKNFMFKKTNIYKNFYDSKSVTATAENGRSILLDYNTSIGQLLSTGIYTITEIDSWGNKNTYYIYLDKIAPDVTNIKKYTNSNLFIDMSDDVWGISKIYYKFEDEPYRFAETDCLTLDDNRQGNYYIKVEDKAGNFSDEKIIVSFTRNDFGNKDNLYNLYKTTSWYKVFLPERIFKTTQKNDSGNYTFETYLNALNYAICKEKEYRVNAVQNGWVYISASNESVAQIYTDIDKLNEVVKYYAEKYISAEQRYNNGINNYYITVDGELNLNPGALTKQNIALPSFLQQYSNLDVFLIQHNSMLGQNIIYGCPVNAKIKMIANDVMQVDSGEITISYDTKIINILKDNGMCKQGYFSITEFDEAGNEQQYILYLDLERPTLTVNAEFGNGNQEILHLDEQYIKDYAGTLYYTTLSLLSLQDNIDDFSCMRITGKNLDKCFLQNETLPILGGDEYSGKYTIDLYDRSLNSLKFEVIIAGEKPYVIHSSLTNENKCTMTLTIPDSINAITDLKIFKLNYAGEYISVKVDDYGNNVGITNLSYIFTTGGKYVFVYTDLFGRTIETKPIFYLKGLPSAEINVTDYAVVNKDISIKYSGQYALVLMYYDNTGKLVSFTDCVTSYQNNIDKYETRIIANDKNSHEYVAHLYNKADRNLFVEYFFEIDTIIAEIEITNANGKLDFDSATNLPFSINWSESVSIYYYTSKMSAGDIASKKYNRGEILKDDAIYYFTMRDSVGNTREFTMQLDGRVSYSLSGDFISLTDKIISKNDLTLTVMEQCSWSCQSSNGTVIQNGSVITENGIYKIHVVDNFGNILDIEIEIDKIPPTIKIEGEFEDKITNSNVTVYFENYYRAYLVDGKELIEISDGQEFSEHGFYKIKAEDIAGNFAIAEFKIDKIVEFSGVINNMISSKHVVPKCEEELKICRLKQNGQLVDYKIGKKIIEAGNYELFLQDFAGNELFLVFSIIPELCREFVLELKDWNITKIDFNNEYLAVSDCVQNNKLSLNQSGNYIIEFATNTEKFTLLLTIDNTPPNVEIKKEDNCVVIGKSDKNNVTFNLLKNGKEIDYKTKIAEKGNYTLIVMDELGNKNIYYFEVKYKPNTATVVLIVLGSVLIAFFLIVFIKSHKKPKIQ